MNKFKKNLLLTVPMLLLVLSNQLLSQSDLHYLGVRMIDDNTAFIVGFGGGSNLWKTTDGGSNWTSELNTSGVLKSLDFIDASTGCVVGDNGSIFVTTNGGTNWDDKSYSSSIYRSVKILSSTDIIVCGQDGTIKSTDFGNDWYSIESARGNKVFFINSNTGFIGYYSLGDFYTSTDAGETFSDNYEGSGFNVNSFFMLGASNGTATGSYGVYNTTDGGNSWFSDNSYTGEMFDITYYSGTEGIAVGSGGKIMKTTNSGQNFNDITSPTLDILFSVSFADKSYGIIGGDNGTILYTSDGGNNWSTDHFDRISKITTNGETKPGFFCLSQNYPNPFNPSTTIKYAVPITSSVILKVYDLLGKEVITLVSEKKQAGYYEAIFNANNLASGIYFYRIVAGDFINVKKMLLVK